MTYFAQLENNLVLQVRVVEKSFMAENPNRYPPQPYASWVLDEDTCLWVAPIAYPAEGDYAWDEQAGDWVEVTDETV